MSVTRETTFRYCKIGILLIGNKGVAMQGFSEGTHNFPNPTYPSQSRSLFSMKTKTLVFQHSRVLKSYLKETGGGT